MKTESQSNNFKGNPDKRKLSIKFLVWEKRKKIKGSSNGNKTTELPCFSVYMKRNEVQSEEKLTDKLLPRPEFHLLLFFRANKENTLLNFSSCMYLHNDPL